MGLLDDALSTLDARKRVFASTLLDWYRNPSVVVPQLLSWAKDDVITGGRKISGLLGDTASVIPEVKAAGQEGLLGMALDFGPGALGTFAGVGAKTANKAALAQAQTMAKAGADPVDVWKATGWTDQFPDGKWRFEIPDNDAAINAGPLPTKWIDGYGNVPAWKTEEAFNHPSLFNAYPDTKNITGSFTTKDVSGEYRRAMPKDLFPDDVDHISLNKYSFETKALTQEQRNAKETLNKQLKMLWDTPEGRAWEKRFDESPATFGEDWQIFTKSPLGVEVLAVEKEIGNISNNATKPAMRDIAKNT